MLHTTPTPNRIHLYSPLGDHREREVSCRICRRGTWNICGRCGRHCDCPETDAIAAVDAAVDVIVDEVHGVLDECMDAVTLDVAAANVRDIHASIGMARLLADMAKESPGSSSAWQMLTSCLAGVQAKVAALR